MPKTVSKKTQVQTVERTKATSPISDLLDAAMLVPNLLRMAPAATGGCDQSWAMRMFHFYGFQTNTIHGGAIRLNPQVKNVSQEIFFSGELDKYPQKVRVCASVTNLGPGMMTVRWDGGSRRLVCNQSETLNIIATRIVVSADKEACMGMFSVTCEAPRGRTVTPPTTGPGTSTGTAPPSITHGITHG